MKNAVAILLLVGLLLVMPTPVSARKWTNTDGFSRQAVLVEVKGGNVSLKGEDGKIVTISLATLSKPDWEYLLSIGEATPTPPEVIAASEKLGGEVALDGNKAVVSVDLNGTKITDAGLVHLQGLTNLSELWLGGPQITDAGVAELEKALPNCIIYNVYSAEPGPVANKKLPQ